MNCYFDGSIGGTSNEWMALGGIVATDGTWAFIEREWPKMLAHRTPSVSALHMTDLATGNGEFKLKHGWTDIEVNALIDDVIGFLGALDRSKYCAFVGPINIEDHKKLKSEGYVMSPPAVICAEISLGSLFNWYRDAHKIELAHLFYDRNEPYIKSIRSRWLQFNRRGRVTTELFWSTIASVQPVVSKDSPGVQMADLIAWSRIRKMRNMANDRWKNLSDILVGTRERSGVLRTTQVDPIDEAMMRRKYSKRSDSTSA